jgi:hypothetical protein
VWERFRDGKTKIVNEVKKKKMNGVGACALKGQESIKRKSKNNFFT